MIPSTSTYQTRQLSKARNPKPKVLIRDHFDITVDKANNATNYIGGSAQNRLAIKYAATATNAVKQVKFFMKSDGSVNQDITVNVVSASASAPYVSAITNGTGIIPAFTNQAVTWKEAYFPNDFTLTSGQDYYFVLSVAGSAYKYFLSEDTSQTGGEYQVDASSSDTWATVTSGAALAMKYLIDDWNLYGTITSLTTCATSGIIKASATSAVVDAHLRKMLTITTSGVSGTSDSKGTSFYITDNNVSTFSVDLDAVGRGIVAGDSFKIESMANFIDITDAVSYQIDEQRDRSINTAGISIYNRYQKYFETHPFGSLLDPGNEIILQLAFGDSEYLNQFRGFINNKNITNKVIALQAQDVMGQFQRFPMNLKNINSIAHEKIIQRVCQKKDLPHMADPSSKTTPADSAFKDGTKALEIMHTVRQSLSWRLYGDQFGRVRFRERKSASLVSISLSNSNYILKNGTSVNADIRDTYNLIGATDFTSALAYDEEILLSTYAGSTAIAALTVAFVSAGVYSNLRWVDTTNDRSVIITETGANRNTGTHNGGTGSLKFKVGSIGGTPNYDIEIYGSKITNLASSNFYVEKTDGESLNQFDYNATKQTIQNKFFVTSSIANDFLDKVLLSNGKNLSRPVVECRGPATLEVEDSLTVVQEDLDTNILFNIRGQNKTVWDNSFQVVYNLEDSTVRTSEVRFDIGLRYDTGIKMDGG